MAENKGRPVSLYKEVQQKIEAASKDGLTIDDIAEIVSFDGSGKEMEIELEGYREDGQVGSAVLVGSNADELRASFEDFMEEQKDVYAAEAFGGTFFPPAPGTLIQGNIENEFVINNGYGDERISLSIAEYADPGPKRAGLPVKFAGNMAIQAVCADGEDRGMPFGSLTKNLGDALPPYYAYVDTNNMSGVGKLLEESGLAEPVGYSKRSGYVEYPLYKFSEDFIRTVQPEGVEDYVDHVRRERMDISVNHLDFGIRYEYQDAMMKAEGRKPTLRQTLLSEERGSMSDAELGTGKDGIGGNAPNEKSDENPNF